MARIMTIDDDEDILYQLRFILTRAGHEVFPLMRTERLVSEVQRLNPDLVITDIVMPGIMGGGVYQLLRKEIGPQLPIIVSSGTKLKLKGSEKDSLLAYCPKPVDYEQLLATILELLNKKQREGQLLDADLDDFGAEKQTE